MQEGKDATLDYGLFSLAAFVFVSSIGKGLGWWRYKHRVSIRSVSA